MKKDKNNKPEKEPKQKHFLSEKKLEEFVTNLAQVKREIRVFTMVEDFFREHIEYNPSILNSIWDVINENDDYDELRDAQKFCRHMDNFRVRRPHLKDYKTAPSPSLRFGKVYIQTMVMESESNPEIIYQKGSMNYLTRVFEGASFNSALTIETLSLIYRDLTKASIISCSKDTFIKAFSNFPLEKIRGKIKWLFKSGGGVHKNSLVTLIHKLVGYASSQGKDWNNKVSSLFTNAEGVRAIENAKRAKYNWGQLYGRVKPNEDVNWSPQCKKVADICDDYLPEEKIKDNEQNED